jgi:hypothetical protein
MMGSSKGAKKILKLPGLQDYVGHLLGFVPQSDFSLVLDVGFSFRIGLHWTRAGYFYSRAREISSAVNILGSLPNR